MLMSCAASGKQEESESEYEEEDEAGEREDGCETYPELFGRIQ